MERLWIGLGALAGLSAVAMAAVTAHGLPDGVAQRVAHGAVEMQGWHALALVFCGLWAPRGGQLVHVAGTAFVVGMLGFCGAVYALAFSNIHAGPVAPVGGTLLMLGWAALGVSAITARA